MTLKSEFGGEGGFLFGAFSAADAFYTVTLARFETYSITPDEKIKPYMELLFNQPSHIALVAEAHKEKWVIKSSEENYPIIKNFRDT